jgi:hypothetical protein
MKYALNFLHYLIIFEKLNEFHGQFVACILQFEHITLERNSGNLALVTWELS